MNCKGDDDVDAKRSRPSIGKPAKCHARKERVLVVGTDQRITSGPAAKRLHSKAGYMAAPERVAKKSDSFPFHRGRRPYIGTADIDRPPAPIASEAYDPTETSTGFRDQPERTCRHWRKCRESFEARLKACSFCSIVLTCRQS